MLGEENSIQYEDNPANTEIKEGDEGNDDVIEEEIIEYDKQRMREEYVTEEYE